MNSFDTGPIYLASLGQELSRNVFVASILFLGAIFSRRKGCGHDLENRDFHENSTFRERYQTAQRKLLGYFGAVLEHVRVLKNDI